MICLPLSPAFKKPTTSTLRCRFASPRESISELFTLFPRVTVEEAKKVIEHLRKYRKEMGADGKKPAAAPKANKAASARAKAAQAKQLNTADLLAELGLDK